MGLDKLKQCFQQGKGTLHPSSHYASENASAFVAKPESGNLPARSLDWMLQQYTATYWHASSNLINDLLLLRFGCYRSQRGSHNCNTISFGTCWPKCSLTHGANPIPWCKSEVKSQRLKLDIPELRVPISGTRTRDSGSEAPWKRNQLRGFEMCPTVGGKIRSHHLKDG